MNSSTVCHEIPRCNGLYVDAFRGPYLKKTADATNTFILSHWHGDHYGNLPRDNKYIGPALIHCTPITASLLRDVHGIASQFVMEHPYGQTWIFHPKQQQQQQQYKQNNSFKESSKENVVKITFYDANHCPGAAIIVFEMPDGKVHIHTGDMRYNRRMQQQCTILREAALAKRIDTVLLDTTYANPKYNFLSQDVAINTIASAVQEIYEKEQAIDNQQNIHDSSSDGKKYSKTLVLLSCYSIGKEKVLWEVSQRTNQLIYVTEKKQKMLRCIGCNIDHEEDGDDDKIHHQLIDRTTTDPTASNIHVIPMGLAGQLWPFFQPNYWACADYATEIISKLPTNNQTAKYTNVVAIIPTGWADGSNWNKKNAITNFDCKGIQVEIRLISYSEHSTYDELQEFIHFLQPRVVVPTVFKDENDKRKIESRFQIDTNRAKQFFLKSMEPNKNSTSQMAETRSPQEGTVHNTISPSSVASIPLLQKRTLSETKLKSDSAVDRDSDNEVINLSDDEHNGDESQLDVTPLLEMGFTYASAKTVLTKCHGNINEAIEMILAGDEDTGTRQCERKQQSTAVTPVVKKEVLSTPSNTKSSTNPKKARTASPQKSQQKTTPTITDFFKFKQQG